MATSTRSGSRAWEPEPAEGVDPAAIEAPSASDTAEADQAAMAAFAAAWTRASEESGELASTDRADASTVPPDVREPRHHVRTSAEYVSQPGIPGRGVIAMSIAAAVAVVLLDFALTGGLSMFFDLWFVVVCLVGAMAVRRQDLFTTGVLAPLLFGGLIAAISVLAPATFSDVGGFGKVFPTGLTAHAGALVAGYGVALLTVGGRVSFKP
jgi:hypothetical protein